MGRTPAQVQQIYKDLEKLAREEVARNPDPAFDSLLPLHMTGVIGYPGNVPLSARRFLSLVSPESPASPGEDDLFSSDLGEEQLAETFGKVRQGGLLAHRLMVLISGSDQAIPDWVDKDGLLRKWRKALDGGRAEGEAEIWDEEGSGLVPGASHALSNDDQAEPRKNLVGRVMTYLKGV